jgi:ABC-type phosphate transport system substrate-binding protein
MVLSTAFISLVAFVALPISHTGALTPAAIAGTGSPFAAPVVTSWADTVGQSPYNVSVDYTPSSSGQGRYEFTNGSVDYAVSDTAMSTGLSYY